MAMRAYILEAFGRPGQVRNDWPTPHPGAGEILVEVHASGVNPADLKIAAGHLGPVAPDLPAIPGMDFAGIVRATGAGVEGFAIGDEVYGCGGGVRGRPGSLAGMMAVDARLTAPKPRSLSMREAAALPLVAITAWEGLVDRARVATGDSVLVQAAAGGVGHIAIQIAAAFGARVFATASSPDKLAIARELGAEPIAYRTTPVADYVVAHTAGIGFDIVYDTVGGAVLEQSAAATRLYGKLVTCAAWEAHDLSAVLGRSLDLIGIFMLLPMLTGHGLARHGGILREVGALVDAGGIRPLLDPTRFVLDEAAAAHAFLESGRAVGKVVIDIHP